MNPRLIGSWDEARMTVGTGSTRCPGVVTTPAGMFSCSGYQLDVDNVGSVAITLPNRPARIGRYEFDGTTLTIEFGSERTTATVAFKGDNVMTLTVDIDGTPVTYGFTRLGTGT